MPKTIYLMGLGLIGSSLALCIKETFPDIMIYGSDLDKASEQMAKEKGIIDDIAVNQEQVCLQADVILLAIPVNACIAQIKWLKTLTLKSNVIVTDVCSTKQAVVEAAADASFCFIGGHPMAGSHKSGVLAADKELFENAYYIFTPDTNQEDTVETLTTLFAGTRAKFLCLKPAEHDEITGMLSHLPHIIASGLVNQSNQLTNKHPRAKQLAAGGFRDMTRIASSDPRMWTDILLTNGQAILTQLAEWQTRMQQLTQWINMKNEKEIYDFFASARSLRDNMPVHENGAIPAFYDLLVDVPDVPGVIAEVTGLLGEQRISIINLRIHETREEIIGILQLSFKTQRDLLAGKQCIESATNYACRLK